MRTERLCWDDHHMLLAQVTAQRSPDPNTQVGACIVNKNNKVLGVGYNGTPKGIHPSHIPWERENEDPLLTKYPYIVHAEKNAIFNATESVEGARVFVTMYPCENCAKDIIQAGIKEVIYLTNPYKDIWWTKAAAEMFDMVDIPTHQHQWNPLAHRIMGAVVSNLEIS